MMWCTDPLSKQYYTNLLTHPLTVCKADKASLSSTDATRNFFNIDYPPLNQLRDTLSVASEKGGVVLKRPTTMHFVAMDEQSVQQLTIKAVLELQIPMGKNVSAMNCQSHICTTKKNLN